MSQVSLSSIDPTGSPADLLQIRILIADDDPVVLASVSEGLRHAGFSTIDAADGASALEICLRTPPNIAILDHDMPKFSGIEIAEKLQPDNRLPLILLSGRDDAALVRRAVEAGAMAYLVKPIDPGRLVPMIWAALHRFDELNALRASNAKLTAALHSTRTTSVAVGVLMEQLRLSEKDAFDRLRQYARSQNAKVADVVSGILARSSELNEMFNTLASTTRKVEAERKPSKIRRRNT